MKKLNKKGVSLAELLAVVVIMGIIAAIAIPLVGNVIETAKKKAFLGDLVAVAEAARTYCTAEGEGKGFCIKYDNAIDVLGEGGSNGVLDTDGNAHEATGNVEFAKYLTKPLTDIATKVYIETNGNVYYVKTVNTNGKYTTTDSAKAKRSLTSSELVKISEEYYINPSFDRALDNIGKAKGSE